MEIVLENYALKASKKTGMFDLFNLHERKSGKSQGNIIRQSLGYELSLVRCFSIIVHERMKAHKEALSLDQFIEKYEKINLEMLEKVEQIAEKLK